MTTASREGANSTSPVNMGPPVASVRARSWRSGLAPEGEDGGGELVGELRWQKVSAAFADRAVPAARTEHIGCPFLELCFPRRDLIGVDVELLRQLGQCSIALDGGVVPPWP